MIGFSSHSPKESNKQVAKLYIKFRVSLFYSSMITGTARYLYDNVSHEVILHAVKLTKVATKSNVYATQVSTAMMDKNSMQNSR